MEKQPKTQLIWLGPQPHKTRTITFIFVFMHFYIHIHTQTHIHDIIWYVYVYIYFFLFSFLSSRVMYLPLIKAMHQYERTGLKLQQIMR